MDDDYEPNAISTSAVKAIEVEEEKEENKIYIYFDVPSDLRGETIEFIVNYKNNEYENGVINLPLILDKSSIPTSFTITTRSTINDRQYTSIPSATLMLQYPKYHQY